MIILKGTRPIAISRFPLVITDRRTDRRTDKAAYRVACTRQKSVLNVNCSILKNMYLNLFMNGIDYHL